MMISGNRRIPLVYSSQKEKEPIFYRYIPQYLTVVKFGYGSITVPPSPPQPHTPSWTFTSIKSASGPFLSASSSDGTTLAFTNLNKVFTSQDSGVTWFETRLNKAWYDIALSADGTKSIVSIPDDYLYISSGGDPGSLLPNVASGIRKWTPVASSSDGTKLLAGDYNGYIYRSTDSGSTWTALTNSGSRPWLSMTCSSDGTVIAATVDNGKIYVSTDSGSNWSETATNQKWYNIACSSNGAKMIAAAYGNYIYTSTDSGATWTARDSIRNWYGVASSSDGTNLFATVTGGFLYTSTDSGVTWVPQISAGSRNWYDVSTSADGTKIIILDSSGNQIFRGIYA